MQPNTHEIAYSKKTCRDKLLRVSATQEVAAEEGEGSNADNAAGIPPTVIAFAKDAVAKRSELCEELQDPSIRALHPDVIFDRFDVKWDRYFEVGGGAAGWVDGGE